MRDHPEFQVAALSLAKLALNWGGLALVGHRTEQARQRYESGIAQVARVIRQSPDWPEARQVASRLSGALAQAHEQAGRFADAAREWSRAVELCDDADRISFRLARAIDLAHAGDAAGAFADAEAIASSAACGPLDMYNMACVASLSAGSAGESGGRADAYASKAVEWLGRAARRGFFRDPVMLDALDRDSDLDTLRSRRDFQLFRLDVAFPTDPLANGR